MISKENLKRLGNLNFAPFLITSLYLNISPLEYPKGEYRLIWKNFQKEILNFPTENREIKKSLLDDVEKISNFVDQEINTTSVNTFVIFSCSAKDWFEVYSLYPSLKSKLVIDKDPYIKPMLRLLASEVPYLVILVSKDNARIFTYYLGELKEEGEVSSEIPKKHKQGGWSASTWQRWHETHVIWHLKDVIEHIQKIVDDKKIILEGTASTIAEFKDLLPKSLQEKVIGDFGIEFDSPIKEILEKTEEFIENYEKKEVEDLVEKIFVNTKKGKDSTFGLEEIAYALYENRIQTLLVTENFEKEGFQCSKCFFISPYLQKCPFCNINMEKRKDIVDEIIEDAINKDAQLIFIRDKSLGEKIENIGALLRF
ncbi:MAG: Vms1/Ankzf1 family peptidyl-tRNA hydrolase [Dictyoglomaceae bacterium]